MFVVLCMIALCVATSTAETRSEGAERLKPYSRAAGVAAVVLALVFLVPW